MILDTLKSTNRVMMDSVQATNDKQAAKKFKAQIFSLNGYTTQLELLLNLIQALKNKGLTTGVITSDVKASLQTAVDNCGEKTNDCTLDESTVLALKNAIELCRTTVDTFWKDIADKKSSTVIDSLTSLKSLLNDKKEAEEILAALTKAKVTMPGSAKAIDAFLANVNRGKKIIDGMHFDSDEEVKGFIEKVRIQKATVGDLSLHILTWLKDNNLSGKIKLRF